MKTRFVDDLIALDVRAFKLKPDVYKVRIEGSNVNIQWENYLFGKRAWFVCPDCGRGCRFLYELENRWTCRVCQGLVYRSQWSGTWQRFVHRERDLLEAVKSGKPKWKHWRTHRGLIRKLGAVQQVLNAAMVARSSGMKQFVLRVATRQVIEEIERR